MSHSIESFAKFIFLFNFTLQSNIECFLYFDFDLDSFNYFFVLNSFV